MQLGSIQKMQHHNIMLCAGRCPLHKQLASLVASRGVGDSKSQHSLDQSAAGLKGGERVPESWTESMAAAQSGCSITLGMLELDRELMLGTLSLVAGCMAAAAELRRGSSDERPHAPPMVNATALWQHGQAGPETEDNSITLAASMLLLKLGVHMVRRYIDRECTVRLGAERLKPLDIRGWAPHYSVHVTYVCMHACMYTTCGIIHASLPQTCLS